MSETGKLPMKLSQGTMADRFLECINSVPVEAGMINHYIRVPTTEGAKNLKVDEVYEDGFKSEGVYYPYGIFAPMAVEDYEMMAKNEAEIFKRLEEEKKELEKEAN
jgi:hypothetical protein